MKPMLSLENVLIRFLLLSALLSCLLVSSFGQTVDFGKSYMNITKQNTGGTIETGDTLEIRASFVVRAGTFDSCAYADIIPPGTTYIPGTLRVLTNEGKVYKQFTDAMNDDCGWVTGSNVRINLGYSTVNAATAFRRGRVASNHKPSFYGSSCIMVASFRVRVVIAMNSNISIGGGTISFQTGVNPVQVYSFPTNVVRVYTNYGMCSNSIGTNAIGTEFNGTFGTGRPRNRGVSTNVPAGYTYQAFDVGMPNDYTYGISNNTSTKSNYSTSNSWAKPDNSSPSHRVFSVWDIIGDHTGAASLTAGNPASDTIASANGGYMLVLNAAYRIDSAFQQTITGLCPNTYYEISCWMRNICSKCGCDSNGKGATDASGPPYYIPTAAGDSSGVYPNVTFEVNGMDYYSTGNLKYTGQWVKKGFVYLTGPSQTSFTLKFFNNAPGGGGNDWALDDISVATCSPNMRYAPTINPTICEGNALTLYDTVQSYFDNYTYYVWQRSTDNGVTWTNVTSPAGPSTPVWNGSNWQYVTSYTVPPVNTQLSDSADRYRVLVATTAANLSNSNCRFTDAGNILTLNVIDCGIPLPITFLSFNGKLINTIPELTWVVSKEEQPLIYTIERSENGKNYSAIGRMNSYGDTSALVNTYTFSDKALMGLAYYRIKVTDHSGKYLYSRTIQLANDNLSLSLIRLINPFQQVLRFDIISPVSEKAKISLVNASGIMVKQTVLPVMTGLNNLSLQGMGQLPAGVYFLEIKIQETIFRRTVLKQHN